MQEDLAGTILLLHGMQPTTTTGADAKDSSALPVLGVWGDDPREGRVMGRQPTPLFVSLVGRRFECELT